MAVGGGVFLSSLIKASISAMAEGVHELRPGVTHMAHQMISWVLREFHDFTETDFRCYSHVGLLIAGGALGSLLPVGGVDAAEAVYLRDVTVGVRWHCWFR